MDLSFVYLDCLESR